MSIEQASEDRQSMVKMEGKDAYIVDAATEEIVDCLRLIVEPIAVTISNNRRYLALVTDGILADIYLMKMEGGQWNDSRLMKRLGCVVKNIQWEESHDSRYPPIEIVVTQEDGRAARIPLR